MLPVSNRKVCGLYIPFMESAPNSGRHYIVRFIFVQATACSALCRQYVTIPTKRQTCFVLCKTIRSVPHADNTLRASQGFFIFFVENVDYAEIQIELDGAVEERRTRPVDRAAVRHPRRLPHRQSVRNESGRKGEITPSRPALRQIGIAQARTDGCAGRVVGKTPSYVDLARQRIGSCSHPRFHARTLERCAGIPSRIRRIVAYATWRLHAYRSCCII